MMEKNKFCLDDLKKNYQKIKEKYDLPDFEKMNQDFSVEKAVDFETDYLIREIRRYVTDRIANYLRFVESLLHPSDVPFFIFLIIKTLKLEDMEKLREIYKKLSKTEVELIELDVKFDEEKEARFIKNSFEIWQDVKKDLLEIVETVKKNWDNKSEGSNKVGYFG